MDYSRIYTSLIDHSKNRVLDNVTFEKHHILPKCLGGSNDANNICKLTLKEHFFAHLLLVKMYPTSYKLHTALWNMCNVSPKEGKTLRYKPSSRIYARIRKDYIETCRGKNHPLYNRKQQASHISKAREGKYKKVYQYNIEGLFIKEWPSAKHVEEVIKIPASNISMVCTGRTACLTLKGFRWSYSFKEKLEPLVRKRKTRANLLLKYK